MAAESELLWHTASPTEVPLVMPAWARAQPLLAERIDAGYELRSSAGLPTDRMPEQPARPFLDEPKWLANERLRWQGVNGPVENG